MYFSTEQRSAVQAVKGSAIPCMVGWIGNTKGSPIWEALAWPEPWVDFLSQVKCKIWKFSIMLNTKYGSAAFATDRQIMAVWVSV